MLGSARKDTCDNIKASKELCVSIVSEPYVEAAKSVQAVSAEDAYANEGNLLS